VTARQRGVVLIVNDDEDARELSVLVLADAGFRCVAAATAEDALARAAIVRFDAIVIDLGLPLREHGLALARRLRAMDESPPLIAVTRHEIIAEFAEGLFAAQLRTPVDPADVVSAVISIVEG